MTKYKCTDCGQEYDNTLETCPNCGCPTTYNIMSKIKCADCRQEYDSAFEACPSCGCPTSNQAEQVRKITKPSQSKARQNRNNPNKKKLIFTILSIIIIGIVAGGIIWYHEHSFELRMARYEKKAVKFKSALEANCCILSETIDSITQKVFYYVKETGSNDEYGTPIRDILAHDLSTGETQSILPSTSSIEDFDLCGIQYRTSKQIGERLFLVIHSNCTWKFGATGVFYINILNNSLHYVESCDNAEFIGLDEICIHKYYKIGYNEYYNIGYNEEKTEYKEYHLSTKLNDEAYAANRQEQKLLELSLANEWHKKEEIRWVKEWLIGTWEWTGYIGSQRVWARLDISDDYIVASSIYGIDDQGQYSIDVDNQTIHYGNYSYAKYDKRKKIYADEGEPYRKVSNTPSFSTKSTSNSYNSSSSSNNGNNIAKQLEKLDEEESRLIDEGNKAVRSGRADVALLKVFKMKDINSERIRLARQSGDSDLVRYYESKKNRSESIIRQWGFN